MTPKKPTYTIMSERTPIVERRLRGINLRLDLSIDSKTELSQFVFDYVISVVT